MGYILKKVSGDKISLGIFLQISDEIHILAINFGNDTTGAYEVEHS